MIPSGHAFAGQKPLPVQPAQNPILCNTHEEPTEYSVRDQDAGAAGP